MNPNETGETLVSPVLLWMFSTSFFSFVIPGEVEGSLVADPLLSTVPVVQRIERRFPKAKAVFLLELSQIARGTQSPSMKAIATTSVFSGVIPNMFGFVHGVTQRVTQFLIALFRRS